MLESGGRHCIVRVQEFLGVLRFRPFDDHTPVCPSRDGRLMLDGEAIERHVSWRQPERLLDVVPPPPVQVRWKVENEIE